MVEEAVAKKYNLCITGEQKAALMQIINSVTFAGNYGEISETVKTVEELLTAINNAPELESDVLEVA